MLCKHCQTNEATTKSGFCGHSCVVLSRISEGKFRSSAKETTHQEIEKLLEEVNCCIADCNSSRQKYKTTDKVHVQCCKCRRISERMVRYIREKRKCACQNPSPKLKYTVEVLNQTIQKAQPTISVCSDFEKTNKHCHFQCSNDKNHIWKAKPYTVLAGHGCPFCSSTKSKPEELIANFLNTHGIQYVRRDKTILNGFELDFYIPEKKIAIEVNGLFWHSFGEKLSKNESDTKTRHLRKTVLCESQGIHLIQLDDEQIMNKWTAVSSLLSSKLQTTCVKIHGRQCVIREVKSKDLRQFLDDNHIQGYIPSSVCLAAYFGNKIIACMTFSKSRFGTYDWEMIRFCVKGGINVRGICSKMFTYFYTTHMKSSQSCVSYADRMLVSKLRNVYQTLGFSLLRETRPGYSWVLNNKKHNRMRYQKHKLSKILSNFDETLTEKQNMIQNSFRLYYDCGQLVYVFKKA